MHKLHARISIYNNRAPIYNDCIPIYNDTRCFCRRNGAKIGTEQALRRRRTPGRGETYGKGGANLANTLKFTSAEELQDKIRDYFCDCEAKHKTPTVTWLAVYLGTNRRTLLNYEKELQITLPEEVRHNISLVLARAMATIEAYAEDRLYDRDSSNGAKFALANNYGWSDRQDLNLGSTGVKIEIDSTLKDYTK